LNANQAQSKLALSAEMELLMRIASWAILTVLSIASLARAQDSPQRIPRDIASEPASVSAPVSIMQTPDPVIAAVVAATMPGVGDRNPVKGMPFAATETIVHEQTLADGTTIKNTGEVRVWRDAEGRKRGEGTRKLSSGSMPQLHIVSVWDPVEGVMKTWTSGSQPEKVAMVMHLPFFKPSGSSDLVSSNPSTGVRGFVLPRTQPAATQAVVSAPVPSRNATSIHTETLPPDNIAGLDAEGTRTTQVIPAGNEGNDRDITVISETWTSPELKIAVRQMTNDPRTGTVTIEITSIDRSEPDPGLFKPPEGYKEMNLPMPGGGSSPQP
jgi:hypothetical protein